MSADPLPLVEMRDVSVRRERTLLVERVSLTVASGSITTLVGPNGAGKSTLIAAMLGEIEFSGRILLHWRGSGRIGLVPQRFAVDPTLPLTAGEFLALSRQHRPVCLGISRGARRRVDALLDEAGLSAAGSRPLGSLSGGEIQRLLLANAMDPLPELLVLDEPATGLDADALRGFEARLLAARAQSGMTVLMVSHDLAQVHRLADLVIVLDRVVTRSGRPRETLANGIDPARAGLTAPPA